MHCIAALSLDGFYLSALADDLPVETACIVLAKDKHVLDASKLARVRGVMVGQPVAEAKAILGKEGSVLLWTEGRFSLAAERWLDLASEFAGVIEPQSEHQALLDLSGHPDPLKAAEELKGSLPFDVSIGLGPNRWIAEASCQAGVLSMVPLLTPRRFIAPLSTLCLEPVDWVDRERLMALGYRTIGDVATLSHSTLRELFGKRAFLVAQAAQGGGNPRLISAYPKAARAELVCFETPPQQWQEVEEAGRILCLRLGEALAREDFVAYDIDVVATGEDGTRNLFQRSFTKPLASARAIEWALSLMLAEPFEVPLERLLVRIKNLERPRRVQAAFDGGLKGADRHEALSRALASLKATFGAQAIEKAASLPVERFQAVRKAWQEANGWIWH